MAGDVAVKQQEALVPWWVVLLQGIFAVLIGLLLLGVGDRSVAQGTMIVVQILGWFWFFTGIMNLVLIFVDSTMWGLKLVVALLGIVAGLYIIQHPIISTALVPLTFVIILGIEGIIIGIVDIVKAFKGGGWGIGLLGVLSIILGGWLLGNRFAATLAAPWAFGILAIAFGIAAIVAAFRYKNA